MGRRCLVAFPQAIFSGLVALQVQRPVASNLLREAYLAYIMVTNSKAVNDSDHEDHGRHAYVQRSG